MVDVTRGAERGKGGEAPSSYSKGCSAPLRGSGPGSKPASRPGAGVGLPVSIAAPV